MTKSIRFAHLADLHLGGWREKKLTQLNFITFKSAIDKILEKNNDGKLDFVLFAGDIFNTPIPQIELVEMVTRELMKLKKAKIPLYVIGGSHDYSNSGKSFISLLETAGLFVDVSKYEIIEKNKINLKFHKDSSGLMISGILGKKNGLDKNIYANLNDYNLSKDNFNIFMFHATLDDIKPDFLKNVKSEVKSDMLPKGFDYYAGGHVHTFIESSYSGAPLSYPGPLFPNNFKELISEKPSFNFCEFDFQTRQTKIKREFLNTYKKEYIKINVDKKNPVEAEAKIKEELENLEIEGKIILIKIEGKIEGKITDIKINNIIRELYNNGAFIVLKNTYKLTNNQIEKIEIDNIKNISQIEEEIIKKNLDADSDYDKNFQLAKKLLTLDLSKVDEEKNAQYEERIKNIISKEVNI